MTIALAKDVEEFLAEQVRAGASSNPSELLNEIVRAVRDQQQLRFKEIAQELGVASESPLIFVRALSRDQSPIGIGLSNRVGAGEPAAEGQQQQIADAHGFENGHWVAMELSQRHHVDERQT